MFPTGTDLSPASSASQSANFLSLAIAAGPGSNYDWENSGIVAVGSLLSCMVTNECLVDGVIENFVSCCIFRFVGDPPCKDEFDNAIEKVDIAKVLTECVVDDPDINDEEETTDVSSVNVTTPGLPSNFASVYERTGSDGQLQMVLCFIRVLLPPGLIDDVTDRLLELFKKLFGVIIDVIDIIDDIIENGVSIIDNGVSLPGEVILFVFGWAELENGKLEAPYKWYYCMFAVRMFLAGIELFKLIAIWFIIWTNR